MFTNERKFQYPLMLDLQLFAGKSATVNGVTFEIDDDKDGAGGGADDDDAADLDADDVLDDIEVEDDDEDGDGDVDGNEGDDGADDSEDGAEGDDSGGDDDASDDDSDAENGDDADGKEDNKAAKGDAKKDNPTAKAVIAERRRLQAQINQLKQQAGLTEKLMKLVGVDNIEVLQQRLDAAEAQRIAKATGVTPEQAAAQIRQQRELDEQRREIRKLKYGQEVAALKADPFFSDIEDFREEFEEIADRTGQTIEQVYMAQRGRKRMKDFEREVEQRTLAKKQQRQKAKVDTSSNGEPIKKEKHDLTPDQLAMAQAAVKMGTFKNVAEYAKFLKKRG